MARQIHFCQACGFHPQPPAPVRYDQAANQARSAAEVRRFFGCLLGAPQITVTMSTQLVKYADSIKFRQA